MSLILMSLRPMFAAAIFNKSKTFEFRRVRTKIQPGDHVLVYESTPISMITGEFEVGKVFYGMSTQLLNLENHSSNRAKAAKYLDGTLNCTAIEIVNPLQWAQARYLNEMYPNIHPPQSYCFITR